jgi:HK97 family phage prohead protease
VGVKSATLSRPVLTKGRRPFFIDFAFKATETKADGTIVIAGYASTWETDRDKQYVTDDAFDASLETYLTNPILLLQHNPDWPIGKITNAYTDDKGLYVEAIIPPPVAEWAQEAYQKIADGVLTAFSIGGMFGVVKDAITAIDLMEISVVSIPANPSAIFEVVMKSFELPPNWDRMPGAATEAKAGRVLSKANEDAIRDALAKLDAVLKSLGEDAGDEGKAFIVRHSKGIGGMSYRDAMTFLNSELNEDVTCPCCQGGDSYRTQDWYINDIPATDDRVIAECWRCGSLYSIPFVILDGDAVWGNISEVRRVTSYVVVPNTEVEPTGNAPVSGSPFIMMAGRPRSTKAMDADSTVTPEDLARLMNLVNTGLMLFVQADELIDAYGDTDIDDAIDVARVAGTAAQTLIANQQTVREAMGG